MPPGAASSKWCDREGLDPLPAAPESVAAYLAERAEARSLATVRRSKTDPEGEGAVQYIGPAAAKALREIQPREAFSGRARVFGLKSGRAVSNRIAAAAKAARLDGRFSGHSPRIGMAVDLVRGRIPARRRAERRKVGQRSHARVLHPGRDSRPGCRRQLLQALGGAGPSGSVPVFMRDLGHGLLAGGAHAC